MKIVIVAEDSELIREVLQKQRHAVVAETNDPAHLRDLILRHTPHFVFWETSENSIREVERLTTIFTSVRFVELGFERGTTWSKTIRQALRTRRINPHWSAEIPEKRQIIFDLRYYALASASDLRKTGLSPHSEEAAAIEALRLGRMLRTAIAVGHRAGLYVEAINAVAGAEWQEITYRSVHKSFKSPAYARDQLGRSLGYLAHFVPGIDLDGLPRPIDEPAQLRFLHYDAPVEMHYAMFGLALFGCDIDLAKQIYRAVHWRFVGEKSEDLVETGMALTGLAFTLHTIGWAHSQAIAWLLDPNTALQLDAPRPRVLNRALQTFRDWWGFRRVMDEKNHLGAVLNDLHVNPSKPPFPEELAIPSFAEFLEAMEASEETKPNQNQPPQ